MNECAEGTHNCHVMSNASCFDTDGSFYCNCTEGFTGNGTFCEGKILWQKSNAVKRLLRHTADVDECQFEDPVCHINATCTNTYGHYFCTCITGFSGNGFECNGVSVL